MDYKQLLISELEKDKDLYLSGEKRPIAQYVVNSGAGLFHIDFYLNESFMFTLSTNEEPKIFAENILDELQKIAKNWRDEHKTTMS